MAGVLCDSLTLNNGQVMPLIGLGTWQSEPGEVGGAVKEAIKHGYRHIDCAFLYGNEAEIGVALQEIFSEGQIKREDLFIVTKLWNAYHQPEDVKVNLRMSLERLQLDYVDLYLMHWPMGFQRGGDPFPRDDTGNLLFDPISPVETWKSMEKLVDEGLVRGIGVSNFNSQQIQAIIDSGSRVPLVNQVEVHPYFGQEKLFRFCQERAVAMTAYSPLGSNARPWAKESDPRPMDDDVINTIANEKGKTPAQVILRWLTHRGIIVIPKSLKPSRIQSNIELADFHLTDAEMTTVSGLDRNLRLVGSYTKPDGSPWLDDDRCPNFPFLIEF